MIILEPLFYIISILAIIFSAIWFWRRRELKARLSINFDIDCVKKINKSHHLIRLVVTVENKGNLKQRLNNVYVEINKLIPNDFSKRKLKVPFLVYNRDRIDYGTYIDNMTDVEPGCSQLIPFEFIVESSEIKNGFHSYIEMINRSKSNSEQSIVWSCEVIYDK